MKRSFYLTPTLILLCSLPRVCEAQCSVRISGDTCAGSTLTANFSGTELETLTWMINGNRAYTAYRSGYNPLPEIAATVDYASCVFVDEKGIVYSSDSPPVTGMTRIQKLLPGTQTPVTLFTVPYDVLDIFVFHDTIYTAGINPAIIQKISIRDSVAITLAGYGTNIRISPVYAVFADNKSNIFVAEQQDSGGRVLWLNEKTGKITVVAGGNGSGSANDQIAFAKDIWLDQDYNLYVLDNTNARIQKWPKGAKSGITVAGGNGIGFYDNQFSDAWTFTMDSDHNFYIADQEATRVVKWKEGEATGKTVAGGYDILSNEINLLYPRGVSLDQSGNMYVADGTSNHVLKFYRSDSVFRNYYPPFAGTITVTATSSGCTSTSSPLRVNQIPVEPATVYGPSSVVENQTNVLFSVDSIPGQTYFWEVPTGCSIVSGQNTAHLTVNWGKKTGKVQVYSVNGCGRSDYFNFKRVTVSGSIKRQQQNDRISVSTNHPFNLFPNPAREFVELAFFSDNVKNYFVVITNSAGLVLQKSNGIAMKGDNRIKLNIGALPTGSYYLYLKPEGETGKHRLFLKQ